MKSMKGKDGSVEQVRVRAGDRVEDWLEMQPGNERRAQVARGMLGRLGGDHLQRMAGSLGLELDLAGAFGGDEPPRSLVHTVASGREQAMVLVDRDLVVAERGRHVLARSL